MPGMGYKGYLGVQEEAAWGVKLLDGPTFQEILSEGLQVKQAILIPSGMNGGRVRTRSALGLRTVEGPLSFECDVESAIGLLLKHTLFSEATVDDGAGNGGEHTFTPGITQPTGGLSVIVGRDVDTMAFYGGRVKELSFTFNPAETLKATAELSFKDADMEETAQDPTYTARPPLVGCEGSLLIDDEPFKVSAANIKISTGIGMRPAIGQSVTQEQQPGALKVTGDLTAYFDSIAMLTKFLEGTSASLFLSLTGGLVGTTVETLAITIPTLVFTGETPVLPGAEAEIMLKLPFEAIQISDAPDAEIIAVLLKNSRRTAY